MSFYKSNYDYEVENSLFSLEDKRKDYIKKYKIFISLIFILNILFNLYIYKFTNLPIFVGLFISLFTILFPIIIVSAVMSSKYNKEFKKIFVKPLMQDIFSDFFYDSKKYIKKENFKQSNLFNDYFNIYTGDDYFSGIVNQHKMALSELNVRHKTSSGSGTSSSSSETIVFQGVFFIASLDNYNGSPIYISPNINEETLKIPKFIMNLLKKFEPKRPPKVETGNLNFDEQFDTFCDNFSDVNILLNDLVQKEILMLHEKYQSFIFSKKSKYKQNKYNKLNSVKISIKDKKIFMAFSGINLFSISMFKKSMKSYNNFVNSIEFVKTLLEFPEKIL